MSSSQHPMLSVVVVIVGDTLEPRADVNHLAGCLEALSRQIDAPPMEIIVPYHENVDRIGDLTRRFPHVSFIAISGLEISPGSREHHDTLRARGMLAAQGDVIALLEDHGRPDERWCANTVAAHRSGYAAIGGAIENDIDRPLNWAVYYCDFGKYQNPLPSGESTFASDANVSYKRSALESIRSTWEKSFREVVVNGMLMSLGEKLALQSNMIVYQHRSDLRLGPALRERYIWGRSYAATRSALLSNSKRMIYAALAPVLPVILMLRMADTAWKRRNHFRQFLGALHFSAMLVVTWSLGECVGYLYGVGSRPLAQ